MSLLPASKPAGVIAGSILCVLIAHEVDMDTSAMGKNGPVQDGVNTSGPEPGRADDFSWEWSGVTAIRDASLSYSIGVRFTNISSDSSRVPNCWAVPAPGRAASLTWDHEPILSAGESDTLLGSVTFERPIPEIDEVVCDPRVAESYRIEPDSGGS